MVTHTHIHTYIHTHTHDNYYNPRCAHAHRGLIIPYLSSRNDGCVVGGENVLLDLWAVAEQLRKEHPKHFDTLTRVRVTFQRIHFDRSLCMQLEFYIIIHIYTRKCKNWEQVKPPHL